MSGKKQRVIQTLLNFLFHWLTLNVHMTDLGTIKIHIFQPSFEPWAPVTRQMLLMGLQKPYLITFIKKILIGASPATVSVNLLCKGPNSKYCSFCG